MGIYKTGKIVRLSRILGKEKTIIVPMDDSLTVGPFRGLYDMHKLLEKICCSKADAILTYKGTFEQNINCIKGKAAILNLSSSTVHSLPTYKHIVNDVKRALIMGFDGVAVHINITSNYEGEMLQGFGRLSEVCDYYEVPLMAIMYPRGEVGDAANNYCELKKLSPEKYKELIMHCVRIAVELGADIIKTQYTGSIDSFRDVINVAEGIPILIAGAEFSDEKTVLENAQEAILAGAQGVCFGRNIFNRENPGDIIKELYDIINKREGDE